MKTNIIFNSLLAFVFAFMGIGILVSMPPNGANAQTKQKAKTELAKPAPVEAEAVQLDTAPPAVVVDAPTVEPAPPAPTGAVDLEWLLTQENAVASVLFFLIAFFSKWLPGLGKINDTQKRALVSGLTVMVGFVAWRFIGGDGFSWQGFLSLGVTYLLTSLGYDKGLKPLGVKTPKVSNPKLAA
jgi:hypothetical protein